MEAEQSDAAEAQQSSATAFDRTALSRSARNRSALRLMVRSKRRNSAALQLQEYLPDVEQQRLLLREPRNSAQARWPEAARVC